MRRLKAVLERRQRSSGPPKSTISPARRLCARCIALDLGSFFDKDFNFCSLGPPSSWSPQGCDFCEFLVHCIPEHLPDGLPAHHILDSQFLLENRDLKSQLDTMGVVARVFEFVDVGHRYSHCAFHDGKNSFALVRTPVELVSRKITPPMIDFNMVHDWLQTRALNGTGAADLQGTRDTVPQDSNTLGNDTVLRVIDCTSRSLLRLPSRTQYVTLSYVWGQQNAITTLSDSENHESDSIPQDLPETINDSIVVCLKLGYKYLWVDRYCIPQDDPEERHRQIQRMDAVYQNSALTIVACAGMDPQYGLPGVTKSRRQCPSISLEGAGYVQEIPSVYDIKASAWASRGWTYQESLFSSARLYFTDQQLYFESDKSVECEWVSLTGTNTTRGNHWIFSKDTWLATPGNIYGCISEFSRRSLSFSGDTLNALLGILEAYDRKFEVAHLCGMPFMKIPVSASARVFARPLPTLQSSLVFETRAGSIRCNEFPSWSWAGWTGFRVWSPYLDNFMNIDVDACVTVELSSDHILSWGEYKIQYETLKKHSGGSVKFIHIQAYVSPILDIRETAHERWSESLFSLSDGSYLRHPVYENNPLWKSATTIHGLEQFSVLKFKTKKICSGSLYDKLPYLLIRNMGTHWERIAMIDALCEDQNGYPLPPDFCPGTFQTIRMG